MNRRSFIGGILAACVAPAAFLPRAHDRGRWRVRRGKGLFIAEYQYAVNYEAAEFEMVFFHRRDTFESARRPLVDPVKLDLAATGVGAHFPKLGEHWDFVSDSMVEIK